MGKDVRRYWDFLRYYSRVKYWSWCKSVQAEKFLEKGRFMTFLELTENLSHISHVYSLGRAPDIDLCVSMQPRQVLEDYTCKTQFWEAIQQNTPQMNTSRPAGELDNSTEVSYSSVIQLTSAAQRSHCVIQQQTQYKRKASLKPKECGAVLQREMSSTKSTGAWSDEPVDGPNILTGALMCLNVQRGLRLWKIQLYNNMKQRARNILGRSPPLKEHWVEC